MVLVLLRNLRQKKVKGYYWETYGTSTRWTLTKPETLILNLKTRWLLNTTDALNKGLQLGQSDLQHGIDWGFRFREFRV